MSLHTTLSYISSFHTLFPLFNRLTNFTNARSLPTNSFREHFLSRVLLRSSRTSIGECLLDKQKSRWSVDVGETEEPPWWSRWSGVPRSTSLRKKLQGNSWKSCRRLSAWQVSRRYKAPRLVWHQTARVARPDKRTSIRGPTFIAVYQLDNRHRYTRCQIFSRLSETRKSTLEWSTLQRCSIPP